MWYLPVVTFPVPGPSPRDEHPDGRPVVSKHDPSKSDVTFLQNHFYTEGRINEDHAIWVLEKATEILRAEPNVLQVDAPITGPSPPSSLQPMR
jgi:serine/threonine-protein phosphatase 2B catalytic subunit